MKTPQNQSKPEPRETERPPVLPDMGGLPLAEYVLSQYYC